MQITDTASPDVAAPAIALPDMLARISVEIDGAACTLGEFQDSLNLTSTGLHEHVPSEQLQALDLLQQTLHDLGNVLAALASMPPFGGQVDTAIVLDRCKLSGLETRLRGGTHPPTSRDVELF